MDEIIEMVINLSYILKYGPLINKLRNFKKKISVYEEVSGSGVTTYKSYALNEIRCLKIPPYSAGTPTYAVFEKHKRTTKVFILNEDIKFMYRLENYAPVANSFYIKLND